jgi:hypothetical protein
VYRLRRYFCGLLLEHVHTNHIADLYLQTLHLLSWIKFM